MDRRENYKFKRRLKKYDKMSFNEKLFYYKLREKNPNYQKEVKKKLVISGFNVEISEYKNPIYIGFQRSEKSIERGKIKRKESMEIKKQFDAELDAFIDRNPDISVTTNPKPLAELEKIKEKYKEQLSARDDNIKRKIKKLRYKVQANFDIWTHFITLSFVENVTDVKIAKSRLMDWIKRMYELFPGFKYVYVMEFQQRGSIHFHVVCSLDPGKKVGKSKFKEILNTWHWGKGDKGSSGIDVQGINYKYIPQKDRKSAEDELKKLDVSEQVKAIWSVGNYLTSYLKKQANEVYLFGSKMYGCSPGLKDEIVITDPKKIAQIQLELGLSELKENAYTVNIKETENTVIKRFYNLLMKKSDLT